MIAGVLFTCSQSDSGRDRDVSARGERGRYVMASRRAPSVTHNLRGSSFSSTSDVSDVSLSFFSSIAYGPASLLVSSVILLSLSLLVLFLPTSLKDVFSTPLLFISRFLQIQ